MTSEESIYYDCWVLRCPLFATQNCGDCGGRFCLEHWQYVRCVNCEKLFQAKKKFIPVFYCLYFSFCSLVMSWLFGFFLWRKETNLANIELVTALITIFALLSVACYLGTILFYCCKLMSEIQNFSSSLILPLEWTEETLEIKFKAINTVNRWLNLFYLCLLLIGFSLLVTYVILFKYAFF